MRRYEGDERRRVSRRSHWILVTFLWGFFLACLTLSTGIGYWLFYPYEPIKVDEIKTFQTEVKQGEQICFQFVGVKLMPVPVSVIIELVNSESIAIMGYTANNPVGKAFKQRCFTVPHTVRPGLYQIRWTGTYSVNPIRDIRKIYLSDFIQIKEDDTLQKEIKALKSTLGLVRDDLASKIKEVGDEQTKRLKNGKGY